MTTTTETVKPMGPIEKDLHERIVREGLLGRKNAMLRLPRSTLGELFVEMDQKPMLGRLAVTSDGATCGTLAGVPLVVDFAAMEEAPQPEAPPSSRLDALEAKIAAQDDKLAQILAAISAKH